MSLKPFLKKSPYPATNMLFFSRCHTALIRTSNKCLHHFFGTLALVLCHAASPVHDATHP